MDLVLPDGAVIGVPEGHVVAEWLSCNGPRHLALEGVTIQPGALWHVPADVAEESDLWRILPNDELKARTSGGTLMTAPGEVKAESAKPKAKAKSTAKRGKSASKAKSAERIHTNAVAEADPVTGYTPQDYADVDEGLRSQAAAELDDESNPMKGTVATEYHLSDPEEA